MDRQKYNACMAPHMRGGGKDRKLRFCVGAKLCSGKAPNEEEAKRLCLIPKEPKPPKAGKSKPGSCEKEVVKLAECVVTYIGDNDLYKQAMNVNSVGTVIANALMSCQCEVK